MIGRMVRWVHRYTTVGLGYCTVHGGIADVDEARCDLHHHDLERDCDLIDLYRRETRR